MNVTDIPIVALVLLHNPDALNPQTPPVVVPPVVQPVAPVIPPAADPVLPPVSPRQPAGPGIEQQSEETALNDFLLSELAGSAPPFAGGDSE